MVSLLFDRQHVVIGELQVLSPIVCSCNSGGGVGRQIGFDDVMVTQETDFPSIAMRPHGCSVVLRSPAISEHRLSACVHSGSKSVARAPTLDTLSAVPSTVFNLRRYLHAS